MGLQGIAQSKRGLRPEQLSKGTVFKIERFAFHDGPGIRTVVFMKGCPLRCVWCSTPHSQLPSPEVLYYEDRCTHCGTCAEICHAGAIGESSSGRLTTDRSLCDGCGVCAEACVAGARRITGKETTVAQVLDEVEKDSRFYRNSGGGITLSGGEPTMQPDFSREILKGCRERSTHTTVETCGYAKWDALDDMLHDLDLLYVDVKHMSATVHERLTTKSNVPILENVRRAAASHPEVAMIIRVPVVPGMNDSEENIRETAQFVHQLGTDAKMELLPYHRLGIPNYAVLSRRYQLPDLQPPSEDRLRALVETVRSCGVAVETEG
jgi:pyruvate formate lyase activating enzyme